MRSCGSFVSVRLCTVVQSVAVEDVASCTDAVKAKKAEAAKQKSAINPGTGAPIQ